MSSTCAVETSIQVISIVLTLITISLNLVTLIAMTTGAGIARHKEFPVTHSINRTAAHEQGENKE